VGIDRLLQDCLAVQLRKVSWLQDVDRAGRLDEAIEKVQKKPSVDLVLVDLQQPVQKSLGLLQELHRQSPSTRVVLRGRNFPQSLPEGLPPALQAGVSGYLARNASWDDLLHTLEQALGRQTVCDPFTARSLFLELNELGQRGRDREQRAALDLPPRQRQVIGLLAEGLSNAEISQRLGVSLSTVKTHVHKLLRRLKVRDRTEAVAVAYQRRWL